MNRIVLTEESLEEIVGGENFTVSTMMALMSVLAILVAVYKMYTSSSGKAKIGNDYSFEWS